jgi:hypothetical protein
VLIPALPRPELAGFNSKLSRSWTQGSEGGRQGGSIPNILGSSLTLETVTGVYACHTIQIDSLYSRAALRHRISSRSCAGTSAKLFSIMRADSGYVDVDRGNSDSHRMRSGPT